MRTLTTRQLAAPLLALALALVLAITLAPGAAEAIITLGDGGGAAEASIEPDKSDGFGVSALLAEPATFTAHTNATFRVRYDRRRAHNAILTRDISNTLVAEVTWEPDGTSGWHTHPGPVIVNVIEGEVTVTNATDCAPRTYGAGEAFLDPGQGNIHIVTNASDTAGAKAVGTFFGVPDAGDAPIMAPPADC
jgi:quercetin dioxygenase-like cupin family protein